MRLSYHAGQQWEDRARKKRSAHFAACRSGATSASKNVFILIPDTVWNPKALETGSVPRKVLHLIALFPRRGVGPGLIARVIMENEPLRYVIALSPFVAAMFIWRNLDAPVPGHALCPVIWAIPKAVAIAPRLGTVLVMDHS